MASIIVLPTSLSPSTTGTWEERLSRAFYRVGAAYEERGQEFSFSLSGVNDGSILFVEAPKAELDRAADAVRAAERTLVAHELQLVSWQVPEAAFRRAWQAGSVVVGQPIPDDVATGFRESGARITDELRVPALVDVPVSLRLGQTVPGIVELSSEIASASAGLQPLTSARFAGLVGQVRLREDEQGLSVHVAGEITWARRDAGEMEMVFRPRTKTKDDEPAVSTAPEKVKIPVLGGGRTPIDARVEIQKDETTRLLHVHVRDGRVHLLLGGVR